MSLIIAKIDRENHTQSVYSDGIAVVGDEILTNNSKKVGHFMYNGICVSYGNTGPAYFNQYISQHFNAVFVTYVKDKQKFERTPEYYLHELPVMFNEMRTKFATEYNIADNDGEIVGEKGTVVVIDGEIYIVSQYKGENFRAKHYEGHDSIACGVGEEAAKCLLDTTLPIEEIYDIISNHYSTVNNNVFAEANYIYLTE